VPKSGGGRSCGFGQRLGVQSKAGGTGGKGAWGDPFCTTCKRPLRCEGPRARVTVYLSATCFILKTGSGEREGQAGGQQKLCKWGGRINQSPGGHVVEGSTVTWRSFRGAWKGKNWGGNGGEKGGCRGTGGLKPCSADLTGGFLYMKKEQSGPRDPTAVPSVLLVALTTSG